MTQDKKELLFKDLCARLPYGVICDMWDELESESESKITERLKMGGLSAFYEHPGFGVRPYLRPMSSMTEEERDDVKKHMKREQIVNVAFYHATEKTYDWYNEHHFDYRGLIEKGLALEAPEGMYKNG